ncbi:hypothetical protein [Micromonospora pisi]|uniref:hypothetical protein n=1 Tax=Micromonospora pisi TaxID=589240 RepID=UPI001476C8CC|nr:hypothetical protein [Micromonospora pisi]
MQDHHRLLTGTDAAELVRARAGEGQFETWFEHDHGRLLAVVTNGTRALIMVLDEPGDAGKHAIDPMATDQQGGYVLSNGQHDTYDNRDTVPLEQALVIVEHLVNHGRPPTGVDWHVDR